MNSKTVAIIGASSDPTKVSNQAIRVFKERGFRVFLVNPKATQIEGLPVYPSIADIPGPLTMISVYLPPTIVLRVLPEIAIKGCEELWLNPGTESPEVIAEAQRLGLHVIQACSVRGNVSPH